MKRKSIHEEVQEIFKEVQGKRGYNNPFIDHEEDGWRALARKLLENS